MKTYKNEIDDATKGFIIGSIRNLTYAVDSYSNLQRKDKDEINNMIKKLKQIINFKENEL